MFTLKSVQVLHEHNKQLSGLRLTVNPAHIEHNLCIAWVQKSIDYKSESTNEQPQCWLNQPSYCNRITYRWGFSPLGGISPASETLQYCCLDLCRVVHPAAEAWPPLRPFHYFHFPYFLNHRCCSSIHEHALGLTSAIHLYFMLCRLQAGLDGADSLSPRDPGERKH